MSCQRPLSAAGFTLLEMLVALAIFALLAVMSYSGLRSVLDQQQAIEQQAERLGDLQKAYMLMQRDFEQALVREVRDEFGDNQPALAGGDNIQFTRGGWSNPLQKPRSSLQRVGYAWEDGELVRYSWQVLDRAQDSQAFRQPVLEDVAALDFRYLSAGQEWVAQWPEPVFDAEAEQDAPVLPVAVEVSIEHEYFGQLVWLFGMPG